MNYLSIERAREKYIEYFEEVQQLERQINLSLLTLSQTLSTPHKKDQTWYVLKEKRENMSNEIEEELHKLEKIRFSAESDSLKEEKSELVNQYNNLIKILREKESVIAEQMRKRIIPVVPFRREALEVGRCYYCKIDITNSFSYQLEKEVQVISNIRIVEGAKFCSQDCLSKYCEKYKKWNRDQQIKREKHQAKINHNKKILTQLQEAETELQKKINDLEKQEQTAKSLYEEEMLNGGTKKTSGWQSFLQKLGIRKANNPLSNLRRIKKLKQDYELELEKKQALISQVLLKLSIDKQFEKEWEAQEKGFLHLERKEKKEAENE
ncbi:MAG: hypothetical protein I3273_02270 [Candidatus Moeniiplasma glomeromycotorum]|nr:hypothetical protein [Candidatus Moeniiplasma glomeromycotorum]MCE8167057.1 hypothetical protein [Candidatus Moeniiplasma glomeromycotorum]MCE8168931.1 hypothetical protein [Candidatus Moeniiplasma glomeromycotorum]